MKQKKKILFMAPYPVGEAPSQRFRYEQYISFLEQQEYQVHHASFYSMKTWKILYKEGAIFQKAGRMLISYFRRFFHLMKLRQYDVVFIHRELAPFGPPVFEFFVAKIMRIPYVYDFDDAIWLPNYSEANASFQKIKMYKKVEKIIKWSGVVTVGNQFLASYAHQFHKNIKIIPTTIDTVNYHNQPTNQAVEKVVVGWTGSHSTMCYLDFIYPVLERLARKHDFIFRIISDQPPTKKFSFLEFVKWNKSTEIEDLKEINIGIMPLENNAWAKGKCGFKGLQYMALEIPTIMSPVGVNTEIVKNEENGYLATTEGEWERTLEKLLISKDLREKLGKAGRKTVENCYSVEANKSKYLEAFNQVLLPKMKD